MNPRWTDNSISVPLLRSAATEESFKVHFAAVEYSLASPITIRNREDIKSARHWSEHLEPYEHQVRNLITFCRRAPVVLIADDVGLGKTVSAGLILSELMARKKVKRTLILCPKLLLPQWVEELTSKFGIQAKHASGGSLEFLLSSNTPVVVTTYESARGRMAELAKSFFDMIILDEAHKLRNLHGPGQPPVMAKALRKSLSDRDFKYVVMLTATPIQNRLWDIYSLVDCLAAAKGHRNPLGSPADFSAYYIGDSVTTARELRPGRREEFRRRISEYMVRTSRRDSHLIFPGRQVQTIGCNAGSAEKELSRLVSETLPDINALARSSLAEALMSSPAALVAQLKNMSENATIPSSVAKRAEVLAASAGPGCKLEKLRAVIAELARAKGEAWRVVLFTRRKETQDLIGRIFAAEGLRVGYIRGGSPDANQRAIQGLRADPPAVNLLISTDAGAEGVNLQSANVVVNYDLPWNPMVVEQRIGRVQRLASKHEFIVVINLVVSDSVEEVVVVRLIAKLQAISETIGDVEGILETTTLGEDRFEDTVRELVIKALMGQDIAEATARIRASIEKAKAVYEQEKSDVEKNLGALDAMHSAGPSLPNLERRAPCLPVDEFVCKALASNGTKLTPLKDGRWFAEPPGRNSVILSFNDSDVDIGGDGFTGIHRGTELYAEGRPAFERLVGEWAKRDATRVARAVAPDVGRLMEIAQIWGDSLGVGTQILGWTGEGTKERFSGEVSVRASASVAHDRYEKIVSIHFSPTIPNGEVHPPNQSAECMQSELDLRRYVDGVIPSVQQAVSDDDEIRGFCEFYDRRKDEELSHAGGDPRRIETVQKNFQPSLAAEVIAANGHLYEEVVGTARIRFEDGGQHDVRLTIDTFAGRVVTEPERATCESSGRHVPVSCLERCEVTGMTVLRHLLRASDRSGRFALKEHLCACGVSGRQLLPDELAQSDVSGILVDDKLLQRSEISGKRGLASEMSVCEFSRVPLLGTEVRKSEVSNRQFRFDEEMRSAVSGVCGHRSEFTKCEESGEYALRSELAQSSVSRKAVLPRLLIPSEKDPLRSGIASETVVCVLSGKRLLVDEVERSVVSGKFADKSTIQYSDKSHAPALPDELVKCEVSGMRLLPSETGVCGATGLRVSRTLLAVSDLSGKSVQSTLLRTCPETQHSGLAHEMGRCEESQLLVDPAQLVQCSVSKMLVLRRLTVVSVISGRAMLRDRAVSAKSGRIGHPDEIVRCLWTGGSLLSDEVIRCKLTHVPLSHGVVHATGICIAHAELIGKHSVQLPAADDMSRRIGFYLEGDVGKPKRLWVVVSADTSVIAGLAEITSMFGLRKRHVVFFFDTGRNRVIGDIAAVEVR